MTRTAGENIQTSRQTEANALDNVGHVYQEQCRPFVQHWRAIDWMLILKRYAKIFDGRGGTSSSTRNAGAGTQEGPLKM